MKAELVALEKKSGSKLPHSKRAAEAFPARATEGPRSLSPERQDATRRRAIRSRMAAGISVPDTRAGLPPAVRWFTVTTTSSTYIDVFFPQVVFTGKLIGEHQLRPGR